jgi:hypothetical protein
VPFVLFVAKRGGWSHMRETTRAKGRGWVVNGRAAGARLNSLPE